MYQSYFGLAEAPFSIAPAPRYLYMSQRHQEALAHLLYGVNSGGGFVLLTGEVGAGKTTVCRCLLEQIPESCDVAYIFNPKLTVEELLSTICAEFGIACPPSNSSIKVFVDCINAHLLDAHARGRHAVLIIDEAQNLSADVLEQMRLLTNLETSERKLLQIILIGQPELATMLERPELKQLAQRIVARYHLGPLSRQEVAAYVRHRLAVAGTQRQLFPAALTRRLHHLSGGVPRIINVLCDRALLGTYVQGKERVDRRTLAQAVSEVLPRSAARLRKQQMLAAGLLVLSGLGLALLNWPATESKLAGVRPVDHSSTTTPSPAALTWPSDIPVARSEPMAYSALFKTWGAKYHNGDTCGQAESQGLHCYNARGGLAELRQVNRPAVLDMRDEQGRAFHVALLKLEPRRATLAIGNKNISVELGILASQWTGNYSLLWRAPAAVQETLRPGASGPAVAWVQAQLARIEGRVHDSAKPPLFNAELEQRIKRLQRARGLNTDGNVGPKTLIHLVGESDTSAPRLIAKMNAAPDDKPLHKQGPK
jgi:general secretion pathway protein A